MSCTITSIWCTYLISNFEKPFPRCLCIDITIAGPYVQKTGIFRIDLGVSLLRQRLSSL
jgi:hypothetical protein